MHPANTQFSLGIAVPVKKHWALNYILSPQWRLIRLGGCPVWSESLLGAHVILLVSLCGGSYAFLAHWWAYRIARPPLSVFVVYCPLSILFKHLLLRNHLANQSNFIWRLHGMGKRKFVKMVQVTWLTWLPCPYIIKSLIFLSGTKRLMTLKVGMQHRVLKYYQVCSNDDPELTVTYFMARSNLVPYAFVWEKGKTMDFSEAFVVYNLKLATDDQQMTRSFCWHQNFVPWGLYAPSPGTIYMYEKIV